jgi:hypothetical protein
VQLFTEMLTAVPKQAPVWRQVDDLLLEMIRKPTCATNVAIGRDGHGSWARWHRLSNIQRVHGD